MSRTAIAILSTENLLHNLAVIKEKVKPAKIIAMVKANAYGHGIRSVALRLDKHVDMLGVASIDEALALRKTGVNVPILLSEGVFEPNELLVAATEKFHVVFHNELQVEWLEKVSLPLPLEAWVKINTGMGRLGFGIEQAKEFYRRISSSPSIAKPVRVMSHFACSDEADHPLNQQQIQVFKDFIKDMQSEFSFCNSGGIFNFPDVHYDYVRPGLALYGISPVKGKSAQDLNLKPVMTLQTSLISTQIFKKGASVGYGARYQCPEDMPVGIIAFGYGDGYPITAQDGTPILVNNVECSLVGRVSMDMIAVDLRNCPYAKIGDPVTLWGTGLPLERVVEHTSNITWDLLTGVQNRVRFLWTRS
ncbi:MAG TPA: alanine racemase [Alphaproteobacteria bacterium]|nr:alanine racemase [Alphaproteobacteria bacterium]HQS93914.1 alanine racemase [Alphaproteobacteria bacterium]